MKLLLDTHALLWALGDPRSLSAKARSRLEDPASLVFVSVVSIWEMEIKRSLGKLDTPEDLSHQLKQLRFQELPLQIRHAQVLRKLPAHHRDPFDRMLVAQAMADGLTVVTRDRIIPRYPVPCLVC